MSTGVIVKAQSSPIVTKRVAPSPKVRLNKDFNVFSLPKLIDRCFLLGTLKERPILYFP